MFTAIAFGIWLVALPFFLGPSVGFHSIKEEKRYEVNKIPTSLFEKVLNGICIGTIVGLLYVECIFPSLVLPYNIIFGVALIVLASFNLIKIIASLFTKEPITVLISFSLRKISHKIVMFFLFWLLLMVALENLHVISTYMK